MAVHYARAGKQGGGAGESDSDDDLHGVQFSSNPSKIQANVRFNCEIAGVSAGVCRLSSGKIQPMCLLNLSTCFACNLRLRGKLWPALHRVLHFVHNCFGASTLHH